MFDINGKTMCFNVVLCCYFYILNGRFYHDCSGSCDFHAFRTVIVLLFLSVLKYMYPTICLKRMKTSEHVTFMLFMSY
jgi:hypothetical protein